MQPETKTEANQYALGYSGLQKNSVYAAQLMIYPLLFLLRLAVVRQRKPAVISSLKLSQNNSRTSYIIYANHQSRLDPLIICASLRFKTLKQLLPFRFFVENSYLNGPMKAFLTLMGGFPAHYEPNQSYGLDRARSLLASQQTIVIFPPGKRTREPIAKSGVSVLAAESDVHLIPVHIDWKNRWSCKVTIGDPVKGGVTHPPQQLMDYVYQLPVQPI